MLTTYTLHVVNVSSANAYRTLIFTHGEVDFGCAWFHERMWLTMLGLKRILTHFKWGIPKVWQTLPQISMTIILTDQTSVFVIPSKLLPQDVNQHWNSHVVPLKFPGKPTNTNRLGPMSAGLPRQRPKVPGALKPSSTVSIKLWILSPAVPRQVANGWTRLQGWSECCGWHLPLMQLENAALMNSILYLILVSHGYVMIMANDECLVEITNDSRQQINMEKKVGGLNNWLFTLLLGFDHLR